MKLTETVATLNLLEIMGAVGLLLLAILVIFLKVSSTEWYMKDD